VKVSANAGPLADAFALAAFIIDRPAARLVEALGAARLTASDGAVTVRANVLDFSIALAVPAEVEDPGEIAMSGARLAALAAAFPRETAVTIQDDRSAARVSGGQSFFKLPRVPLADLPATLELPEETGHVVLDRADALALFERTLFAASADQKKFYLNGICLRTADAALHAIATDGSRLVRCRLPGAVGLPSDHRLIVPRAAAKIIIRLLSDKSIGRVVLRSSSNLFAVETAGFAFVAKLVDGAFPDYERVIPPASGHAATVARKDLERALDRAGAVLVGRPVVGLRWSEAEPVLRLCPVDSDAVADEIPAEVVGHGAVAAPIGQLAELVAEISGERIRFGSGAKDGSTVRVTDPSDEKFLALLRPGRAPG
jgi:DNA polymerase-3 subunit beta